MLVSKEIIKDNRPISLISAYVLKMFFNIYGWKARKVLRFPIENL